MKVFTFLVLFPTNERNIVLCALLVLTVNSGQGALLSVLGIKDVKHGEVTVFFLSSYRINLFGVWLPITGPGGLNIIEYVFFYVQAACLKFRFVKICPWDLCINSLGIRQNSYLCTGRTAMTERTREMASDGYGGSLRICMAYKCQFTAIT